MGGWVVGCGGGHRGDRPTHVDGGSTPRYITVHDKYATGQLRSWAVHDTAMMCTHTMPNNIPSDFSRGRVRIRELQLLRPLARACLPRGPCAIWTSFVVPKSRTERAPYTAVDGWDLHDIVRH